MSSNSRACFWCTCSEHVLFSDILKALLKISKKCLDKISTEANGIFALIPPNKYMPIKLKKRKNKALFLIGGNGSGYKIKKKDINFKKLPVPPSGKRIKNVEVVIKLEKVK